MYWMLLPFDANAARHFSDATGPLSGPWGDLLKTAWARIVGQLGARGR